MAKVLIVSNRLPISVKKVNAKLVFSPSVGGLATGLSSYTSDEGSTWIGWPGIASDELTEDEKQQITNHLAKQNSYPVFLTKKQIDNFYSGYSNSVLWPRFHGLQVKKVDPELLQTWWQTYKKVNSLFMEAVLNLIETKSQIWIHDYQLMLLPELLRQEHGNNSIGYFLHIPFPELKSFSLIPEQKKLINGMLGANLIGFHTSNYVQNFLDAVKEDGIGDITENSVQVNDRVVRVSDFPMGIDYEKYAAAHKSREVRRAIRRYKNKFRRKKVIVSVDRLDPSKGLEERMKAYATFLEQNPKLHGKIVFAMVVAPSRTDIPAYKNLSKKLDALTLSINQKYGHSRWQPLDYINVAQPFEEVSALFQVADIAFIAPLRDGMNLSAKEFVASSKKHGVLILSDTAGAAEELKDAIIVNPRDPENLVLGLEQALFMRKQELRSRIVRMKKQLSINTVQYWAASFIDTLQQPLPDALHLTRTLNKQLQKQIKHEYSNSLSRLLLLDYDGSLVPYHNDYRQATPPKNLIQLLQKLSEDPNNSVVIISGRNSSDLDDWFGGLSLSLVAEHGASMKRAGNDKWQILEKSDTTWKQVILPSLEKYARLTPGAKVEEKPHSLVWHYRNASPYQAQKYTVIIKHGLKPILKSYELELVHGNKVLEIKNPHVNKATAARPWLSKAYEFILTIGDDVTDESIFLVLPDSAYGIKIGRGRSAARYRLKSYKEVQSLLQNLVKK